MRDFLDKLMSRKFLLTRGESLNMSESFGSNTITLTSDDKSDILRTGLPLHMIFLLEEVNRATISFRLVSSSTLASIVANWRLSLISSTHSDVLNDLAKDKK